MARNLDVRIQGDSMWPTFTDGQTLTFQETDSQTTFEVGDVVLALSPFES